MQINPNDSPSQHLVSAASRASTLAPLPLSQEKAITISPAVVRGRLRVQDGSKQDDGLTDPHKLHFELKKMKLVLDAKRSQHRKMDQWLHTRFVGKLISRVYLDELASDVAWLEASVNRAAQELDLTQHVNPVTPEAPPHQPSHSLGKGA
jgi:hypothetical protein